MKKLIFNRRFLIIGPVPVDRVRGGGWWGVYRWTGGRSFPLFAQEQEDCGGGATLENVRLLLDCDIDCTTLDCIVSPEDDLGNYKILKERTGALNLPCCINGSCDAPRDPHVSTPPKLLAS